MTEQIVCIGVVSIVIDKNVCFSTYSVVARQTIVLLKVVNRRQVARSQVVQTTILVVKIFHQNGTASKAKTLKKEARVCVCIEEPGIGRYLPFKDKVLA